MIARARENARGTQEIDQRRGLEPGQPPLPLPVAAPRRQRAVPGEPGPVLRRRSSRRASSSTAWSTAPCRGTRSTISSSWAATSSGSTRSAGSPRQVPGAPRTATPAPPRRCGSSTGRASCGAARRTRPTSATYHDRIEPESVVRYLVLDADFPRAIRFCVAALPRVAPRDRRRRPGRLRLRGRAPARPPRQRAALHRRRRDLRPRAPQLPARRPGRLQRASATRSTTPISRPEASVRDPLPWRERVPARCPGGSMLLRIQHETKLTYSEPVPETVFEVRMAPAVRRGPDEPGLPAADDARGPGDALPRRVRQPGRPVQHHDPVPGAGDPGDDPGADPPPRRPRRGSV